MYCSPIIPAVWIEAFDSLDNLSYCFSISSSTTGAISLDPKTLSPVVELDIEKQYDKLSSESKASIQTAGIIGEQYISITPGFYDEDMGTTYLNDGDVIHDTGSALVLEDLISKFVFNSSADKKDSQDKEQAAKDEVAQ